MSGIGYTSAVLLAVVLGWAGVGKLRAPRSTAASFAALGLPWPVLLARAVPAVELGVAVVLLPAPRFGATAAAVLLVGFTAVLVVTVARGLDAGCACFGRAESRPVSATEIVRNAGLLLLAAGAAVPRRPVMPTLADMVLVTTAFAAAFVLLAVVDTRRDLGRLWDNRLAGEAR